MKTIIITRDDHLAVSFWRDSDPARAAMGDDDPIAGLAFRPKDLLVTWDWKGKSGAKDLHDLGA